MFFNKFAICSIPYFNFCIGDSLALALNSLRLFTYFVSQVVFYFLLLNYLLYHKMTKAILWAIWCIKRKRKKKEISNNWFKKSTRPILNHIKNCHFPQCNHSLFCLFFCVSLSFISLTYRTFSNFGKAKQENNLHGITVVYFDQ